MKSVLRVAKELATDRAYVLYGAPDELVDDIYQTLKDCDVRVEAIVYNASEKQGKSVGDLSIQKPTPDLLKNRYVLVLSEASYDDIAKSLKSKGLIEDVDFSSVYYSPLPTELRRDWDIDLKTLEDTFEDTHCYPEELKYYRREEVLRWQWRNAQRWLWEYLGQSDKPHKVLDVGAGSGAFLKLVDFLGHEGIGLEPSKSKWEITSLAEKDNVTLLDHSGDDLPYPFTDNQFDIVVTTRAINFFSACPDWREVLEEFSRIATRCILVIANKDDALIANRHHLENWDNGKFRLVENTPAVYKYVTASA